MTLCSKVLFALAIAASFVTTTAQAQGTAIKITGLYVGGAADYADAETGGVSGVIGLRYLTLDYRKSFNYFGTLALSTDVFSGSEERDAAREVEGITEDVQFTESLFSGYIASAGLTYNTQMLDNIVFYAGPEIMLGETITTLSEGSYLSISDQRFGFLGGVILGFERFFIGVDYSSNTESLRATLGFSL